MSQDTEATVPHTPLHVIAGVVHDLLVTEQNEARAHRRWEVEQRERLERHALVFLGGAAAGLLVLAIASAVAAAVALAFLHGP